MSGTVGAGSLRTAAARGLDRSGARCCATSRPSALRRQNDQRIWAYGDQLGRGPRQLDDEGRRGQRPARHGQETTSPLDRRGQQPEEPNGQRHNPERSQEEQRQDPRRDPGRRSHRQERSGENEEAPRSQICPRARPPLEPPAPAPHSPKPVSAYACPITTNLHSTRRLPPKTLAEAQRLERLALPISTQKSGAAEGRGQPPCQQAAGAAAVTRHHTHTTPPSTKSPNPPRGRTRKLEFDARKHPRSRAGWRAVVANPTRQDLQG